MKYTFGDKLRAVREKKKMTMKDVAEKAGVSESLISQIETNKVSPAIETLLTISEILDIDLEYLFSDLKKKRKVNLVRFEMRNKIILENVTYEQLVKTVEEKNEHGIEAYYMTIEKGGKSGSDEYGHKGKELGVIISGSGDFTIGGQTMHLNEGDSISFDSDVPHSLVNSGNKDLKAFWVITPPKTFMNTI